MTNTTPLKITVIGTGYVGLVSGTCFAEMGFDVTCVDINKEKIRKLVEEGVIPIYETGLEEMVERNKVAGRLHFTTNLATCVPSSDAVFIAVGTPQDEDGSADLQYVCAAAQDIAQHLQGYTVIVDKSTVPVGTGDMVNDVIAKTNPKADFAVCSNPEFLREGNAVSDFIQPDRIVVGCPNQQSIDIMRRIYAPLTDKGHKFLQTNVRTAELIKYAGNAFLATKITFINEVAALCDKVGADVERVALGIGLDSRIGEKFLQTGPGYGGSCFPKDTNAMAKIGRDNGITLNIVETVIQTNEAIKAEMAERIINACNGDINGKTVAVLGLAFKADTDDMRDAPAYSIIPILEKMGANIRAYDPESMEQAKAKLTNISYCETMQDATNNADIAVILTEWNEFKYMDLGQLKTSLKTPILVDLRNLFDPPDMAKRGFNYHSIGRPLAVVDEINNNKTQVA